MKVYHAHGGHAWCPGTSEEDVGFPRTGVTEGGEPPKPLLGRQHRFSARSGSLKLVVLV